MTIGLTLVRREAAAEAHPGLNHRTACLCKKINSTIGVLIKY